MSETEKYGAPGAAAHRLDAPMGGEARDYLHLVDVNHPDRSSSFPTIPMRPVYLRVDTTHELPVVALDGLGKEVARFKHLADAAHFLNPDQTVPPTLPFPIVIAARRDDGDQLEIPDFLRRSAR